MELDSHFIHRYKRKYHLNSGIPQCILDADLKINWYNTAFSTLFYRDDDLSGLHIGGFSEFKGCDNRSLYHQLSDSKTGFSFCGEGIARFQHYPAIYTTIQILPIIDYESGKEKVIGFDASFFNITEQNKRQTQAIFSSLLQASLMKDNDTGKHIQRVNEYSSLMAQRLYEDGTDLQVNMDFVENISFLAAMHDVGKIGIPDDILNKAGSLDEWEWEVMKTHTLNGAYILGAYPDPMAVEIARSHHERWDGSGYPYGLMNEMIPLSARIVTIADVYDALRIKRSYKDEMPHDRAAELIILGKGTQFDPELISLFEDLLPEFETIFSAMQDPDPVGPSGREH